MTRREALQYGQEQLKAAGIYDHAVDAWALLEYVCKISKSQYYMEPQESLTSQQEEQYRTAISRRAEHIPLQHITGYAWFMGLQLEVNEHVLIPRYDTEVLVAQVLERMHGGENILDVCTGSGCILLALLHERPDATGLGVDISEEALQVAKKNAENAGIPATFIQSDLFHQITGKYDIIVSNPPYIPSEVIDQLDPEVRAHEPMLALDGHQDGLYFYRKIAAQATEYLTPQGLLCLEIGYDQGEAVKELLVKNGFSHVEVIQDLAGLDRVVIGGKHV